MLKVAMQAAGCGNGAPAARSAWDASQTRESVRTCRGHERFTRATEGGQRAPAPEVRIRALKKGEGGRERMRGRERQKEKDRERERDRETVRGGESLLPDRARSYSAKGGAAACQLTVVQVRAGVRPSMCAGEEDPNGHLDTPLFPPPTLPLISPALLDTSWPAGGGGPLRAAGPAPHQGMEDRAAW
ncbi:unnamed protein product, partial [Prorocentrum cordatum]